MEQNQQPQPPVFKEVQQQPAAPQYQPRVTATPMMQPIEAIVTCLKKYFDIKGRARRSEFWWFALFVFIVSSVLTYLSGLVPAVAYVSAVFTIGTFIPLLTALTRRMHDINRSGIWVAMLALCFLGYYVTFAMLFGPNISMFANSADVMGMADDIVDIVQSSQGLAVLMLCFSMGAILFFIIDHILAAFDSKWGENKYGPSPKYQ